MDELQRASEIISLIQPLFWGLALWGFWSLKKIFVTIKDCAEKRASCAERWDGLDREQHKLERRDTALEARLDAYPPGEEIRGLRVEMARMGGDIKTLGAELRGQGQAVERIETNVKMLMEHHLK